METLNDLAQRARGRGSLPVIARDATIRSAPATVDDALYVSLDSQPAGKRGPCRGWAPRYAGSPLAEVLPQPGDPCIVIPTGTQLVIVAWWPADA